MSEQKEYIIKPNLFQKINGWVRLFIWGVCPKCNHDAPELYDCETCAYYGNLPRYKGEQTKDIRNKVWDQFKRGIKSK